MARKPRSREVAEKINEYLHRFEHNPEINFRRRYDPSGTGAYFCAQATHTGNGRVLVRYVDYQGSTTMSLAEAEAYLAWLDAGNVGTHYEQQRAALAPAPTL